MLAKKSTDIRTSLLDCLISGFEYCEHEWPSGILFGTDGATAEECKLILDEVLLARELDVEGRLTEYLNTFETKVLLYQSTLRAGPQ